MAKVNRGRAYAKALLNELNVSGPGDPRTIATELQLDINELDVQGFGGGLVRVKGTPLAAIIVRDSIREARRKNFTVAHELGHFVLPGHDMSGAVADRRILETGETLHKSLSAKLMSLPPNCYSLVNMPVHGSKASRLRSE
jgi:hypothetical protein